MVLSKDILSSLKRGRVPKSKGEKLLGMSRGEMYNLQERLASVEAIRNFKKSKEALEEKWGEGSTLSKIRSIFGVGDVAAGIGERLGFFGEDIEADYDPIARLKGKDVEMYKGVELAQDKLEDELTQDAIFQGVNLGASFLFPNVSSLFGLDTKLAEITKGLGIWDKVGDALGLGAGDIADITKIIAGGGDPSALAETIVGGGNWWDKLGGVIGKYGPGMVGEGVKMTILEALKKDLKINGDLAPLMEEFTQKDYTDELDWLRGSSEEDYYGGSSLEREGY